MTLSYLQVISPKLLMLHICMMCDLFVIAEFLAVLYARIRVLG